ncbi:arrestin domain-containing protein 3-like isoform 2-T2 [Pholidichthys leucotaenia]
MFEKKFRNFHIEFDGQDGGNTFSSGDMVTGRIWFDLSRETKIISITMRLKGWARVHWSEGHGKHRRRRHAKLDFFDLKGIILHENRVTGRTTKHPPGRHMYPFSCRIPHGNFPSSFHAANGQVSYTLTVGINRPWHLSKDFVIELNFVNRIDTSSAELRAPLSGSNSMRLCCLWCSSGPITMTVSLEKKAFTPGETVKIMCTFSNASSTMATPKVKLQQNQIFYTHNRASRHMVFKGLVSVTGEPVSAHTSEVQSEIMLTIPSSTSLTISNCSILVVDYIIEVNLCVSGLFVTVVFPIIVCDSPVHTLYA